ncbi:MAG: FliM/FliN family flagellar motor switch protein [Deltaproteobacteria bacterium]|nr:FliM/FliN family flagellar motor switch protein [Deltaproteobacteria bacterium]
MNSKIETFKIEQYVSAKSAKDLHGVSRYLHPLKEPFFSSEFAGLINKQNVFATLKKIGPYFPGLNSESYIFIAVRDSLENDNRMVFALTLRDALFLNTLVITQKNINTGEPATDERELTSGQRGLLLFIADTLAGDFMNIVPCEFQIMGILDDESLVKEYLNPLWHGEFEIKCRDFNIDIFLISDSLPDLELPLKRDLNQIKSDYLNWPVSFRIIEGETFLKIADVKELKKRDIVIFENISHPFSAGNKNGQNSLATLICGEYKIKVLFLDADRFKILSINNNNGNSKNGDCKMSSDEITARYSPENDENLSMDINVQIEAGRLTFKMMDVLNLIPGQIIRLDKPVTSKVDVRVADSIVANGTLVSVDGELGVRIDEVK